MDTNKSKIFTDITMADEAAKRRGKEIHWLGKDTNNHNVYYVGNYQNAMKAKSKYYDCRN